MVKSLKLKKNRVRERKFTVEGVKSTLELLDSKYNIDFVVGTSQFLAAYAQNLEEAEVEIKEVKAKDLESISHFKSSDACLAVVQMKDNVELWDGNGRVFLLDGVSDPGNLGTIIRTMNWFGYGHLLCSPDCADLYNPKTIAASMGSFLHVEVIHMELSGLIRTHQDIPIYAAMLEGTFLNQVAFPDSCMIVMGSESHGISETIKELVNHRVTIPSFGQAESLNVAVATSIIGYQLSLS